MIYILKLVMKKKNLQYNHAHPNNNFKILYHYSILEVKKKVFLK